MDNKYGCDALQRMYEDFAGDTDGAMPGVQVHLLLCSIIQNFGRLMRGEQATSSQPCCHTAARCAFWGTTCAARSEGPDQPAPELLHVHPLRACIHALSERLACTRVFTYPAAYTAAHLPWDSEIVVHPQIPELPDNLKPAPGAEAAVVPKRRYQPARPEEHFYAAMRAACASMELLVKDGRWVLAPPALHIWQ